MNYYIINLDSSYISNLILLFNQALFNSFNYLYLINPSMIFDEIRLYGNYEPIAVVGSGSFGMVVKAIDTKIMK